MIHGYHVVLPMYGFWLPNDPRGAWSDYIRKWELTQFGSATKTSERRKLEELSTAELEKRKAARKNLKYPPVSIDGRQALAIGKGFGSKIAASNYTVWACSILPEHTHIVIARHSYRIEQIANLLKGASTRQIIEEGLHPLANFAVDGQRPPRMWSSQSWKVYLDSEQAIENAIHYVEENPKKEDKPGQEWSFTTRFGGINKFGWTTYH